MGNLLSTILVESYTHNYDLINMLNMFMKNITNLNEDILMIFSFYLKVQIDKQNLWLNL